MPWHVCLAIWPKHAVALMIVFFIGKSAVAAACWQGKERHLTGGHFWARGYAVSTEGFEESPHGPRGVKELRHKELRHEDDHL